MSLTVSAIYAGLLGLILIGLIFRVIALRYRRGVGLGDGGHPDLARAVRVHGNFVETVPLALILIAILESMRGPAPLLHALGIVLVLARLFHAYGLTGSDGASFGRGAGMVGTIGVILIAALACLARTFGLF